MLEIYLKANMNIVITTARLNSFQNRFFLESSLYGIFSNSKTFTVKSATQSGLSGLHSLLLGKHMVYFLKVLMSLHNVFFFPHQLGLYRVYATLWKTGLYRRVLQTKGNAFNFLLTIFQLLKHEQKHIRT